MAISTPRKTKELPKSFIWSGFLLNSEEAEGTELPQSESPIFQIYSKSR